MAVSMDSTIQGALDLSERLAVVLMVTRDSRRRARHHSIGSPRVHQQRIS